MLRYNVPPVTISGQHGRIWTTQPNPCQTHGLVAVLQVPASKFSESVRSPSFTTVAMDSRADMLVTADSRGQVYVFDIRQNRYNCLDKVGSAGTAALLHGPRSIFIAFADCSIRCYDASKGTVVGMLREHRSPVRHLEVNRELNEMLSTSVDAVLVWDIKKLRRKRVLGSGPYGALQASYTPDGLAVVTQFKDGSFYIWAAGSFALLRSFTLPVAPPLRPAQTSFSLSPDGQLLVACGPTLPLLLVYSVIGGELRYGVGLPAPPAPLDVAVATAVAKPPLPPQAAAAAALAASLPMYLGVQQARFLPDSTTVAALLTDGSVAFVDVVGCRLLGRVPYQFPNRRDCGFTSDARLHHMALRANGKVMLYDLANSRTEVEPPEPLRRIEVSHLEDLAAAVALEHLRRQQEEPQDDEEQLAGAGKAEGAAPQIPDTQALPDKPATPRGSRPGSALARNGAGIGGQAGWQAAAPPSAAAHGAAGGAGVRKQGSTVEPGALLLPKRGKPGAAISNQIAQSGNITLVAGSPPGRSRAAKSDAAAVSLNRTRLEALLEAFGEYPAKYRLMIWEFLLQLPHNTAAFASLAGLGMHDAFKDVPSRLPLANRALAQRLAATLSQLAHWCPVFAESSFLPDLVFPFVKLFASSPAMYGGTGAGARASAALDERCFETLATLLCGGWMRGWWERFPHPPLGLLTRLQDLLALHDAPLGRHFATFRGGLAGVVWPHLATMWTELLARGDWLRLWDHCITAGPTFLYHFVTAYWISLRSPLLALDTDHKLANWLAGPPEIDMGEVIKTAYQLRSRTPPELQPVPAEWQPLPQGPTYIEFKGFPAGAVELFAADRARIRDAEDAIMRRRAVVSELEMRTRAVALQAASLSTERQQLAALEQERRAMLRQLEADTAMELARLDDRAKEEKLKQIAAVEKAYQDNLLEVRATWQRELEYARAEMAHKRAMAAQQLRSRQEDEQIKALEFHAQQRMRAMEEDVRRAAVASAVRDELLAHQMEAEGKQQAKIKEWEAEDEARKLRLQAETARRAELATVAEEAAARSAAAREAQALALRIDDELIKVEGERRLRRLAEDAALMTAEARAAEEARVAARLAAEQEALRLRSQADTAWFEAEQMRREQLLVQERQQMEAAAAAARRKLLDTEAAARAMAAQSELLERRRFLERQNAAEEAQMQVLVSAMAAERGRDAVLMSELDAKEEEMRAKLDHVARVGSMQREVESREAAAAAALLAQLDEQQRRELAELRKAQQEALERLGRELEGQAAEAAARRRAELQSEQLTALRAQQLAFEQRKEDLARELMLKAERRARASAPAQPEGEIPAEEPQATAEAQQAMSQQAQPEPPPRAQAPAKPETQPAQAPSPSSIWAPSDVTSSVRALTTIVQAVEQLPAPERVPLGAAAAAARTPAPAPTSMVQPRPAMAAALPSAAQAVALMLLQRAAALDAGATPGSSGVLTPTRTYDFLTDSNLTPASYVSSSYRSSTMASPEPAVHRPPGNQPQKSAVVPARERLEDRPSAAAIVPRSTAPSRVDLRPSTAATLQRPAGSVALPGPEPAAAFASLSHTPGDSASTSSGTVPLRSTLARSAAAAAAEDVFATTRPATSAATASAAGTLLAPPHGNIPAASRPSVPAAAGAVVGPGAPAAGGLAIEDGMSSTSLSPGVLDSASTSASLLSSRVRLPGPGPLERSADASVAAATAMQRAALAVAQAVSPERSRWDARLESTRHSSPSSVTGSLLQSSLLLGRGPEADFGGPAGPQGDVLGGAGDLFPAASESDGEAAFRRLLAGLYGGSSTASPASGSVLIGSSLDSTLGLPSGFSTARTGPDAGQGPPPVPPAAPVPASVPAPAAAAPSPIDPGAATTPSPYARLVAAALGSGASPTSSSITPAPLSSGGTVSMGPRVTESDGAAAASRAGGLAASSGGRDQAESSLASGLTTDSWTSLQRSGLLGLSQPTLSAPLMPAQPQPGFGAARPRATWSQPGAAHSRYDTSTASSFGTSSATSPALTSNTTAAGASTPSYSSYTSFTPALRPGAAAPREEEQRQSQPGQSQPVAQLQQRHPESQEPPPPQQQQPRPTGGVLRDWGYLESGSSASVSASASPQTVLSGSLPASSRATAYSAAGPTQDPAGASAAAAAASAGHMGLAPAFPAKDAAQETALLGASPSSVGPSAGPPGQGMYSRLPSPPELYQQAAALRGTASAPIFSPASGTGRSTPDPSGSSAGFLSATDSSGLASVLLLGGGIGVAGEGFLTDRSVSSGVISSSGGGGGLSVPAGRGSGGGGTVHPGAAAASDLRAREFPESSDPRPTASASSGQQLSASGGSGGGATAAALDPLILITSSYERSFDGGDSRYPSSGELRSGLGGTDGGGGSSEAASGGLGGGAGMTGSSSYVTRSSLTRGSTPATGRTADTGDSRLSEKAQLSYSQRPVESSVRSVDATPEGSTAPSTARLVGSRASLFGQRASLSAGGSSGGAPSPDVAQLLRLLHLAGEDDSDIGSTARERDRPSVGSMGAQPSWHSPPPAHKPAPQQPPQHQRPPGANAASGPRSSGAHGDESSGYRDSSSDWRGATSGVSESYSSSGRGGAPMTPQDASQTPGPGNLAGWEIPGLAPAGLLPGQEGHHGFGSRVDSAAGSDSDADRAAEGARAAGRSGSRYATADPQPPRGGLSGGGAAAGRPGMPHAGSGDTSAPALPPASSRTLPSAPRYSWGATGSPNPSLAVTQFGPGETEAGGADGSGGRSGESGGGSSALQPEYLTRAVTERGRSSSGGSGGSRGTGGGGWQDLTPPHTGRTDSHGSTTVTPGGTTNLAATPGGFSDTTPGGTLQPGPTPGSALLTGLAASPSTLRASGDGGSSPGGLTDLDASLQRLEAGLRWGDGPATPSTSTDLFSTADPRWLLTGATTLTDSTGLERSFDVPPP